MSDLYDRRRKDFDTLGRGIRHVDRQIGALACVSGQPLALDLVSRADVFAALVPPLAQRYALDAFGGTESEPDPRRAEHFLRGALAAPRGERRTVGLGRAFALGTPAPIGAGLEHEGELIQLAAFPSEGVATRTSPRVARPSRRRRY
jgi:hypothetical protein